jgi:hypothetical protein
MATRIAIGLLLAASFSASFPVLAAKPEVVVEFEIAVPEFTQNLPERNKAIQTLRSAYAKEFQRQFVFARWLTEAPAQPQMQLGRLVVRLEQDKDTKPNPWVFVRLWGARPNGPLKELGLPELEIYAPGNPNWDTNSRGDFETRVLTQTMEKVRNDAFREKLFKQFLAKLPISSAIEPRATERVIEIPVRWSEVLLSSETELVVEFDKQAPQGSRLGTMKLGRIATRVHGPASATGEPPEFPAWLRGSITEASFDAVKIHLDQQNWSDQVPQVLTGAKALCFISKYMPRDELAGDSDRLGL